MKTKIHYSLLLMLFGSSAFAQTFTDDFNIANTSAGDLGSDWTVVGGPFINGNEVAVQSDIGIATHDAISLTSGGFTVSGDFKTLAGVNGLNSGVLFNYDTTAKTGLVVRFTTADASSGVQLLTYDDGVIGLINQATITGGITQNAYYNLQVGTSDTAFDYDWVVSDSGGTIASGTLTDTGSTAIAGVSGLYFGGTFVRADNFSLVAVPEPSSFALLAALSCCAFVGMSRRRIGHKR